MSKLIVYDFKCDNGHVSEHYVKSDILIAKCVTCGNEAKRLISRPRIDPKMGVDPTGFPTAGDKWARTRIQRAKIEKAYHTEHGDDLVRS